MTRHAIDLAPLTRAQLKQLAKDVADELEAREHDERIALEDKLRALVEEHGFDPKDLRFAGNGKRGSRRTRTKGESNDA